MSKVESLLLGLLIGATIVLTVHVRTLQHQVTKLNHACVPTYTGGGVTQCAQPNMVQAKPR